MSTPVEFVQKYHKLCVKTDPAPDPTDDGQYLVWNIFVKISHYQINGSSRAVSALRHDGLPLVQKMKAAAQAHMIRVDGKMVPLKEATSTVWRSFVGKGSPDDIALTLRLALRYKVTTFSTLRAFCKEYLGEDCSGFVSNYANCELGKDFDVANKGARSFAPLNQRRLSLDDIRPLDVLVWAQTNHVAIIDSLDQNRINFDRMKSDSWNLKSLTCTVAESNGHRGIGSCDYTISDMDATTHQYTAKRQEDGTTWKVWVAWL